MRRATSSTATKGVRGRRKGAPEPGESSPRAPVVVAGAASLEAIPQPLRAAQVGALQGLHGNRAVSRMVARSRSNHVQRDADGDAATAAAEEVYAALDGWNDEPRMFRAINGLGAGVRSHVPSAFSGAGHGSIWGWYKDQLSTEDAINAYATTISGNAFGDEVAMARAILPSGTRDAEVWRLLGRDLSGRQRLETKYDETFGGTSGALGLGSMKQDLRDDLSGWAREKAIAMLDHELTKAEQIYFDSVAITGTHTESVVAAVQEAGQTGAAGLQAIERDWDSFVRSDTGGRAPLAQSRSGWHTAPDSEEFSGVPDFRAAMRSELGGEDWDLVNAVFTAVDRGAQGTEALPAGVADAERTLFEQEEVRLNMALGRLDAATTGGYTGIGTNETEMTAAVGQVREIWQGRLTRARAASPANPELVARYERDWQAAQTRLGSVITSEADADTEAGRRARLIAAGPLTPADEVWLKKEDLDYDGAIDKCYEYWAQGRWGEVVQGAGQTRSDASGTQLRASFDPLFLVPITHGLRHARLRALINNSDDVARGASRIKVEVDDSDGNAGITAIKGVLTLQGVTAARRTEIVDNYVSRFLQGGEGTGASRFMASMRRHYGESGAFFDVQDLVSPAQTMQDRLDRARARQNAENSGVGNYILNGFVDDYDAATGEDSRRVAAESLARLEFIVTQSRARPAEVDAMAALAGATSPEALAQLEYDAFVSRLNEVRALKKTIADALATAVELAAAAALTALTGGAGAGALVVALGSALAGMAAREILLGNEYDLVTQENLNALMVAAAGAGVGALAAGKFAEVVGQATMDRLGRAGLFMAEASQEAASQMAQHTMQIAMMNGTPSVEDIASHAIQAAASTVGAGARGAMATKIQDPTTGQRVRTAFAGNAAQNVISNVGATAGGLVQTGAGNKTGLEIAGDFGGAAARGVGQGMGGAAAELAGQAHAARQERNAGGGPDTPPPTQGQPPAQTQPPADAGGTTPPPTHPPAPDANQGTTTPPVRPPAPDANQGGTHPPAGDQAQGGQRPPGEDQGGQRPPGEGGTPAAPRVVDPVAEADFQRIGPVSEETRRMLEADPELRALYARHPRAVAAMKKCASPCLPSHATEPQLTRFELLLTRMEQAGYDPRTADYQQQLKDFFHRSENMNNLDGALASFEVTVRQMEDISAAVRIATTGEGVELPRTPEEWTAMRNSVQQAQATLNNPGASPDQIRGALEAIARLAVAQARAYLATTAAPANAATPFTGEALAGMCGVGRDISADVVSQATIGQRTPVVIERMQAAQMGIPGVDARHAFTVVTLPDGSRFLIDPTFAQFATPARRGMTAQGMQGTPEGAALSRELLTNGFIRLTGDTATQYALGLGASPELAQAYGAAIMFGHGSVLTEFVQNGRVVRVSARPGEADNTLLAPLTADQDGVGGSTVDLRRALQNLPANAPLRPILEDLLARLRGLLAVQTPVAQLPGAQPPPAAP